MRYEIEFEGDELDAATNWHGGQASMLYAIASTGSLKLGTIRPSKRCEGERCDFLHGCKACQGRTRIPLTDAEWFADLCWRLAGEAEECAESAEDPDEQIALESIASKASIAAKKAERNVR